MKRNTNIRELVSTLESSGPRGPEWNQLLSETIQVTSAALARCSDLLSRDKSLIPEAISLSEACGNLTMIVQTLEDLSELGDGSSSFSALDRENELILNRAYVIHRRSENTLNSFRRACFNQRPPGERLARAAVLASGDDMQAWQNTFLHELHVSEGSMASEFDAFAKAGRAKELKAIINTLQQVTVDEKTVEVALKKARSALEQVTTNTNLTQKVLLLGRLHEAYASLDQDECLNILDDLETDGIHELLDTNDQALIHDVTNWVDRQREEDDRLNTFNARLLDLERALDDDVPSSDLEKIYIDLQNHDEAIPANLETRYQAHLNSRVRSERTRLRVLVSLAAIAIAFTAIAAGSWYAYSSWQQELADKAAMIVADCNAGRIDQARKRHTELLNSIGASRNQDVKQAGVVLHEAELDQSEADDRIHALIEISGEEEGGDDWLESNITKMTTYLEEPPSPSEPVRIEATLQIKAWESTLAALQEEAYRSLETETNALSRRMARAMNRSKGLASNSLEKRIPEIQSIREESVRISEAGQELLKESRIPVELKTRIQETCNRAERLSGDLADDLASLKPAMELMVALESSRTPSKTRKIIEDLVRNHAEILTEVDVNPADWNEALQASIIGEALTIWLEEIRPILAAVDGDLSSLSNNELQNLVETASAASQSFKSSPFNEQIDIIQSTGTSKIRLDQRPISERLHDEIESLGFLNVITAEVVSDELSRGVRIFGRGVSENKNNQPFKHWLPTTTSLSLSEIQLQTGRSVLNKLCDGLPRYRRSGNPGEWAVSNQLTESLEAMKGENRLKTTLQMLQLIDEMNDVPIENANARLAVMFGLWNSLAKAGEWPASGLGKIRQELEFFQKANRRLLEHDWIKEEYSANGANRNIRDQSLVALKNLPSTDSIREGIMVESQTLKESLRLNRPAGIMLHGGELTREVRGVTDGTYLALGREPGDTTWVFVQINVKDGFAPLVADTVPNGPTLLYELRQ